MKMTSNVIGPMFFTLSDGRDIQIFPKELDNLLRQHYDSKAGEPKIGIPVNDIEQQFTISELSKIVTDYYNGLSLNPASSKNVEMAKKPTIGKYFRVDPEELVKMIPAFEKLNFKSRKKADWTRNFIVAALKAAKENPDKYMKQFNIYLPIKTWETQRVCDLVDMARREGEGSHCCDSVELGMVWAQRIVNNETWDSLCEELDDSNYYGIVLFPKTTKNSVEWEPKLVGSATVVGMNCSPTEVSKYRIEETHEINSAIPYIVTYDNISTAE